MALAGWIVDHHMALLWTAEVVWVVALSVWILFERRSPAATVAWILALAALPVAGLLIYFFFGPRRFDRKKLRHARGQAKARAAGAHASDAIPPTHRATHLMRMVRQAAGPSAVPRRGALRIFAEGDTLYDAVVEDIAKACDHVHVEYYIFEPDEVGTRLRDALTERARAGVRVRLLVDGFGSSSAASGAFFAPLREAGGHVERFNALKITRWRPRLANFRTHRKIVVVDGRVAYTGGMNVTRVHSRRASGDDAWRDTHARVEGHAARGLQMTFAEDWYYATEQEPDNAECFPAPEKLPQEDHLLQVAASGPDENENAIHKLFFSAIAGAQSRVWLTTAYFVPDLAIMTALVATAMRGVDVRILLPAKGDVRVVAAAARSYFDELLAAGVRIFEYGPNVLHAKTLVTDEDVAIIGTANTDNRSFKLNFEVSLACYEPEVARELAAIFETDLERATEVLAEDRARRGRFTELKENIARLLSPIL
ncbi:MAG: cardiolipin synthase [Deltaproteobacteria bacterium]|nr:cardiolipin synthase [Deltaproteobacteria bacterium]